jgi:hypothetical protein
MTRKIVAVLAGLTLTLGVVATASSAEAVPAKKYKNCTQLNKVYPHGVGKPGARDKTSGTPVKTFKVSKALYTLNKGSDRDKDGIACEKA